MKRVAGGFPPTDLDQPMKYIDDYAVGILNGTCTLQDLVDANLKDNPFPKSLRQHAGFWARVARDPRRVRLVRRKAALHAMGCIAAARAVDNLKKLRPMPRGE